MTSYPTNVTDMQWQMIIPYINLVERKRKYPLREIFNAVFYVVKIGCQWRMLPRDFAPWNLVYYYFRKRKNNGTFEEILSVLVGAVKVAVGKDESPSLGIIDSRSVKTSHHVDSDRGIDGNKKIKGRKEHIVTDVLGLPLAIVIHAANVFDGVGRKRFSKISQTSTRDLGKYWRMEDIGAKTCPARPQNSAGNFLWC